MEIKSWWIIHCLFRISCLGNVFKHNNFNHCSDFRDLYSQYQKSWQTQMVNYNLIPCCNSYLIFFLDLNNIYLTTHNGFMAAPLLKELKFLHLYPLPYNWKKVKAALPLLLIRTQLSCCPQTLRVSVLPNQSRNAATNVIQDRWQPFEKTHWKKTNT